MSEAEKDNMVTINVDGRSLQAKKGQMLIEVTDAAGITIPRFCYHPKLSIAANCRMCLVEVEKAPKPLPACATPVMDGMTVMTQSAKTIDAQKGTMEFLLINHPLDCPVCDQGGECELQDLSMAYGSGDSRYAEEKRAVPDKDIGPLVATEMTRCIHCTRCVRFGDEVAGLREMGAVNRGEHVEIGTYVEKALVSELSGNIIDICPVGALTAKPSRFVGRPWEYRQHRAISPHDGVGSNLYIHTLLNKIVRVVSRPAEDINETWIADRDRFSYEAVLSAERAQHPVAKYEGEISWEKALERARDALQAIIDNHGAEQIGVIVSPNTSQEEAWMLKQLCKQLGVSAIDYRLQQKDFRHDDAQSDYLPWLGQSIAELEENQSILLLGANIRMDQPMLGHRVRKAALDGAIVTSLGTQDYDFRFPYISHKSTPNQLLARIAALAVESAKLTDVDVPSHLQDLAQQASDFDAAAVVKSLKDSDPSTVVIGAELISSPHYAVINQCAAIIANATDASLAHLPHGANHTGLGMMGLAGEEHLGAMLDNPKKAYILWNVEPDADIALGQKAREALTSAEFVLAASTFTNQCQYADIILPIAAFGEHHGTKVNVAGMSQSYAAAQLPTGEARPGWKVIRALADFLDVPSSDAQDISALQDEIATAISAVRPIAPKLDQTKYDIDLYAEGLAVTGGMGIYHIDALVRRAPSLQATPLADASVLRINPATASELGLSDGDQVDLGVGADYAITLDERIAEGVLNVRFGFADTAILGDTVDIAAKAEEQLS